MKIALSFLLALLSCSCVAPTSYQVEVNALAAEGATAARDFVVESSVAEQPLLWEEYRGFVQRALVGEGWRPADPGTADLVVRVSYGISDPDQVEYQVQTPVYGQTGTTTTYQTVYDPTSGYGTQAVTTPQFGVQYYQSSTEIGVVYHRHLVLTAFRRATDGSVSGEPLWEVRLRSSGSSGDMRQVFPALVAAARPYLGKSSGREVSVRLPESGKEIRAIVEG